MLISLNWLKEYIDLEGITVNELEHSLTMIGQEVEKIELKGTHLAYVITAQITEKLAHPESDHLTVCKVNTGTEIVEVICGAPNHKSGDKVILAQVGAKLSEDFVIKKSKIRGIESNGMLCSEDEIGVGSDKSGIIILPQDTPIGMSAQEYFGINDTIFELEITPNRPDCLSHIGIARELSVYYNKPLKYPIIPEFAESSEKANEILAITVQDADVSKRYAVRIMKDITIKESPKWLKDRLESIGIRSINNVVDISNFVLMELNHPNHIFDLDQIEENHIIVRKAKENETLVTLDGKERILTTDDIVITDPKKILGLAGVMGGLNSEVTDQTTNVCIEVAHFNPLNIKKTSRRLGLFSDAAYRFERNIDIEDTQIVLDRIVQLVQSVAGGTIVSEMVDKYPEKYKPATVTFNFERFYRFVGKEIPKETIINIFKRLEIIVENQTDTLVLTAPTFRPDLSREQDYYEEIIRIYGFDNIANVLPKLDMKETELIDNTFILDKIKDLAVSVGLNEVINYSFIPKNGASQVCFTRTPEEKFIHISNPITEDFVVMRPTLLFSLLKNAKDNMNRSIYDIHFFEISRTFMYDEEKKPVEETKLGIILAGEPEKYLWNAKPEQYNFYQLKGLIEEIFDQLSFKNYQIQRTTQTEYHPGRAADIFVGKEYIGSFGEIHPNVLENFDFGKKSILVAEISIDAIKKYLSKKMIYKSASKFQSVSRDLALVVDKDVLVGNMIQSIQKISPLIEKIELFDIYKGIGVENGKKSVAINVVLRDKSKTLEEKDITTVMDKILNKLNKQYNAELRS